DFVACRSSCNPCSFRGLPGVTGGVLAGSRVNSSQETPRACHRARTRGQAGSCAPVSSLVMVRRWQPARSASAFCVRPAPSRNSFSLAPNTVGGQPPCLVIESALKEKVGKYPLGGLTIHPLEGIITVYSTCRSLTTRSLAANLPAAHGLSRDL